MIYVNASAEPKWGMNNDAEKTEFVSNMVQKHLVPRYSNNKEWCDFFHYLTERPAFSGSDHYYRYLNTFGMIVTQLGKIADKTIVETGGASPISTYLARNNHCYATESDLRMHFDVDSDFADIVVSFEVIEHIKDAPEKNISEVALFKETGVRSFASEIHRITRPGGCVVFTTPNACSYKAISNAVDHKAPCVFRPHVREYTKGELLDIFCQLDLQHHSTMFNFFMLGDSYKKWDDIFLNIGWSITDRGDDHFFYGTKPGAQDHRQA